MFGRRRSREGRHTYIDLEEALMQAHGAPGQYDRQEHYRAVATDLEMRACERHVGWTDPGEGHGLWLQTNGTDSECLTTIPEQGADSARDLLQGDNRQHLYAVDMCRPIRVRRVLEVASTVDSRDQDNWAAALVC